MMTLRDSIEIEAAMEKAFDALIRVFSSQDCFLEWHEDHVACRWNNGKPFEEGSVLYVEEYLHGTLHRMRFQITRFDPPKVIEYRFLFPFSMVFPKGSFVFEERRAGCIFTAIMCIRFGRVISRIAKKRAEALKAHMKGEGESLKRIVEQ